MKVETLCSSPTSAEEENLETLFGHINLNDNVNVQEEPNLKLKDEILDKNLDIGVKQNESLEELNENCLDGLTSLKKKANLSCIKSKHNDIEDHDEGPQSSVGRQNASDKILTQKIYTRGPLRGKKAPLHILRPYSGTSSGTSNNLVSYEGHQATRNHLLYSGGDVVTLNQVNGIQDMDQALSLDLLNEEPLIPDFFQLGLENVSLPTKSSYTPISPDVISLDDGILETPVSSDVLPLDDILDDAVKTFLSTDLLSEDFFPDLGVSELFVNFLDTNTNDSSAPIIQDQSSPLSIESGYGSPDSRSCSSSPVLANIVLPKKKRVKYFDGLDEKLCDKFRRAILKKANEKDGLSQKDKRDMTLLHVAIEQKNEVYAVVFLNMLHKSYENGTGQTTLPTFADLPSFLDQEDRYGRTPLLLACMFNFPRVVEFLLECGASPMLKETFNNGSVFHYVCERGDRFKRVLEILCARAHAYIDMPNSNKETPLHIAVGYHGLKHHDSSSGGVENVHNASLIQLLLEKNAKLSVQDNLGRTPLHWMIMTKNLDLLEILYSKALDWNQAVDLQNAHGKTVLHGAAECNDLDLEKQKDLIEKLVVRYASPMVQDIWGKYPKDLLAEDRKMHFSILNGDFCEQFLNQRVI